MHFINRNFWYCIQIIFFFFLGELLVFKSIFCSCINVCVWLLIFITRQLYKLKSIITLNKTCVKPYKDEKPLPLDLPLAKYMYLHSSLIKCLIQLYCSQMCAGKLDTEFIVFYYLVSIHRYYPANYNQPLLPLTVPTLFCVLKTVRPEIGWKLLFANSVSCNQLMQRAQRNGISCSESM